MRVKTNLSVALLTFLLGVSISQLRDGSTTVERPKLTARNPSADEPAPTRVSVCDLLNDATLYQSKRFQFEGVLYSTDTALLVNENCSNIRGQVPVVAIGFEDISDDLSRLLDALDGVRRPSKMEVDVRVIGEIDRYYQDDDLYLHVVVKRFERLSPLRKFKLRGAA